MQNVLGVKKNLIKKLKKNKHGSFQSGKDMTLHSAVKGAQSWESGDLDEFWLLFQPLPSSGQCMISP